MRVLLFEVNISHLEETTVPSVLFILLQMYVYKLIRWSIKNFLRLLELCRINTKVSFRVHFYLALSWR